MRAHRIAVVVALLGEMGAEASAQELIALRDMPDISMYAATAQDLRDDIEPRYALTASYAGWLETSSHADDDRDHELSIGTVFGARTRADRFVHGRAYLAGMERAHGDHRLRAVYGIGPLTDERVGPLVEVDLALRHGDPTRAFGAATEPGRDANHASGLVRGWLGERVRMCGCGRNTLLLPVGYRTTYADFTGLDGTTSTARVHEAMSGVGSRLGDGIQIDGWWEWIGVSGSRVEIDSPAPRALGGNETAQPVRASLNRVDLRLLNINDVVMSHDDHWMTTHRIAMGHTWLWNRATGRDADIVTGTMSAAIRFPSGSQVGFAVGRNVRLADTADRFHTETRIEALADARFGSMGATARLSASHNTPLGVVAPTDRESFWSEAIHTAWHVEIPGGVKAGLQHIASLRFVPTAPGREWTHYLGAFVSFTTTSNDPGMLR